MADGYGIMLRMDLPAQPDPVPPEVIATIISLWKAGHPITKIKIATGLPMVRVVAVIDEYKERRK